MTITKAGRGCLMEKYPFPSRPWELGSFTVFEVIPLQNPVSGRPRAGSSPDTGRAWRLDPTQSDHPSLPFPFSHQEDRKEGMSAFVEKRKASFKDQ